MSQGEFYGSGMIALIGLVLTSSAGGCSPGRAVEEVAGHYTWGHEVRSFQPCSGDEVYWVAADSTTMEQLQTRHSELTTEPYESVFVRLTGNVGDVPVEYRHGFAGDYDELFTIEAVYEIRSPADSDCQKTEIQ